MSSAVRGSAHRDGAFNHVAMTGDSFLPLVPPFRTLHAQGASSSSTSTSRRVRSLLPAERMRLGRPDTSVAAQALRSHAEAAVGGRRDQLGICISCELWT